LKICVTATSGSLDAQVDPRFGRCQYFIIVDDETMEFEALPNPGIGSMSGAGIQAAQEVANKNVKVVITGHVGPNAYQVLTSAGIDIITGAFGTVRNVVEQFKSGELKKTEITPTVPMGFGMSRGMRRGIGRGIGINTPKITPTITQTSKEQEITMLESQMESLQQQLEQIKKRIEELKK
jgi:predicted Fe-Mo cluster-binding NifX family protein